MDPSRPFDPHVADPEPVAPTHAAMCDAKPAARSNSFDRAVRMVVVGCALGALPSASLLAAKPPEPASNEVQASKAPKVPDELAQGLRLGEAMVAMYGAYDSLRGGVVWTAAGLSGDHAWRNGSPFLVRPHAARRFTEGSRERVLLVTHTLDIDGGRIVPAGESCHACAVLVGMALFERRFGGAWQPIAISQGAARAGSWGAMPQAAIEGNFSAPALRIDDAYMAQGQVSEWTTIVRYRDGAFKEELVSRRVKRAGETRLR